MDIYRIRQEVYRAQQQFAYVELHPTTDGGVFVKAAFQTSAGGTYITAIYFQNYPNAIPQVYVTAPALLASPHRYTAGNLCLLHPTMWNPGLHDLTFILGRIAKWLAKYEVYCATRNWPGAGLAH